MILLFFFVAFPKYILKMIQNLLKKGVQVHIVSKKLYGRNFYEE